MAVLLVQISSVMAQKPGSLTAVDFDGTDDYVSVPDQTALNPTTKITVEAWIKADEFAKTNFGNSILCKHGWSTGNKGFVLRCGDGKANFNIANASGAWVEAVSASILKTGNWYHIAGVFNGDSVLVYINGNLEGATAYSGAMSPSTGLAAKIGDIAYTAQGNRYFKGQIDEVRVWNTALSKANIRNWMCRKVSASHPDFTNLAAYYKLDEGSGVDAKDKSGNANTGTLTNGPKWITSGAALGDSSAHVYGTSTLVLPSKYGDVFTVKNISGAPAMVHTYITYDTTVQAASKNVLGAIDSTHFYGVYYETNTAVKFDINYDFKNLAKVQGAKKCGVNMLYKIPGNIGSWDYTPSKLYDGGDSLVIKKQTKNEFVMALYQTDSTKLLSTNTGRNWFCGGDSLMLIAAANDSFTYVWYKNSGVLAGKTKKNLWVSSDGIYKVKMSRRGTSCSFTSSAMPIGSRSTLVTWGLSLNICENNDSIALTQGSPNGGFYSGKWVTSNGFFHPKKAGAGNHTLFYNLLDSNNCTNKTSIVAQLNDTTKLTVSAWPDLCITGAKVNLDNVSPSGGIYKGLGVVSNTFSPVLAGLGTKLISYTLTKANSCISKTSFKAIVHTPDSISVTLKDKACSFDEPIAIHTFPKGGVLKGSAVIAPNFYPLFATKGWNWVYYNFTESHQCLVRDSARIYVADITKTTLPKWPSVCDNTPEFNLSGGQPKDSGVYWVQGIKSAKFNPAAKGKGLYKIEYKVVNYFGCRDSSSATLRVNVSPLKPSISVSGNTLQSSSAFGNQWLDKNGLISGATQETFAPVVDGYYFVKVTNDSSCSKLSDSVQFAKIGINETPQHLVTIFPNPSYNGIIHLKGLSDYAEIQVFNIVGSELNLGKIESKNTVLDLSKYGHGTFIIRIKTGDSFTNYRVIL